MATPVEFADVLRARERITGIVHRTPVMTSATLDRELGGRLFVKCENLQKVGAFKARGACNAVMALADDEVRRGVVTHSSGNHAGALAWAAAQRGAPCAVVMPESAPSVKVAAVRGYGAEVVFCKPAEREQVCERVRQERGAVMVHPFENAHVIAGQGTAALELFEDVPDLDVVIAPVGGGGLLAGTAIVARAVRPRVEVYGSEPLAVDDAARSLASGIRQPRVDNPKTCADGLLTALGEPNFALLVRHGAKVQTVDEAAIVAAARFFLERMKLVVEPSGATVLAAARALGAAIAGKRVGLIVSGGNTDFAWLR